MTRKRRWLRCVLCLAVCPSTAPAVAVQQQPPPDPAAVAQQYVAAMQLGNWTAMAELMDPAELMAMRELLTPLFENPEATEFRHQFLGVGTVEEAVALSDTAMFAAFMGFIGSQDPTLAEAIRTSRVEVIGHVREGPDTAHVVYRMTMTVEGIDISQMDVFSLRRRGTTWRGLLAGDLSALAAALREALETPPDPQ